MTILCVSKQHFNFTFLCPSECQPDMFFFNKGTQVLVDKCYNRQCKSLCTCISLFGVIGICLVLLTETIYIFLSEKYKEIAFSGWAATILYCFICLSNLSNAQCSYLLHFSTTIGSQRQAKNAENFSSTLLITEVLDYCVVAMVDATTHSSSCLSFLEKKSIYLLFPPLEPWQLLQIWSY